MIHENIIISRQYGTKLRIVSSVHFKLGYRVDGNLESVSFFKGNAIFNNLSSDAFRWRSGRERRTHRNISNFLLCKYHQTDNILIEFHNVVTGNIEISFRGKGLISVLNLSHYWSFCKIYIYLFSWCVFGSNL